MGREEDMRIFYLPNSYSQQRQREKPAHIYSVLLAMEAEWYRKQGHTVYWGNEDVPYYPFGLNDYAYAPDKTITEPEGLPFLSLPHPDRVFTRAKEYTSGNYKYLPGTHIMSASGCWWGRCVFCVEKGKPFELRSVDDVIEEIKECKALGFREIFDDAATIHPGFWLSEFCEKLKPLNIRMGCNVRCFNFPYKKMKEAGFRMLLFGLESANQYTLDRINKGVKVEDVRYIIEAAKAGLDCHVAVMFGYPWETDGDALRTLRLVWELLRKGYAKTAQASFYTTNEQSNEAHRKYVKQIYRAAVSPEFWFNQLKDIRNVDDLKYLWRKIKEGVKNV